MRRLAALAVLALSLSCAPRGGVAGMDHLVVIYLENHSFDNLYGEFAGADGLSSAKPEQTVQTDMASAPIDCLPQTDAHLTTPPLAEGACHFPNAPFAIDDYVAPHQKTRDLVHRFYQEQAQIHDGKMDRFVAVSDAKGLTQGYYRTAGLPLAKLAKQYVLADHFFHAAYGGSFLNHFWLVCACTPSFPGAPADMHAILDPATGLPAGNGDKAMAPAGEDLVLNTTFSAIAPHPGVVPADHLLPAQDMPTIGDRLTSKGVSWAWYSGGWNDAVAGKPDALFQFHHQAFAYFAKYAEGTPGRRHLRDETAFLDDAKSGKLPAVSFVKPLGSDNEHPGYTDLLRGERHVVDLVNAIRRGAQWASTAIVITYDENGGFWDHVAPPKRDRFGPGARVPTLVISPLAKRGFVDHTSYDTTSILALIEHRFDLRPLGTADANAADMSVAFK